MQSANCAIAYISCIGRLPVESHGSVPSPSTGPTLQVQPRYIFFLPMMHNQFQGSPLNRQAIDSLTVQSYTIISCLSLFCYDRKMSLFSLPTFILKISWLGDRCIAATFISFTSPNIVICIYLWLKHGTVHVPHLKNLQYVHRTLQNMCICSLGGCRIAYTKSPFTCKLQDWASIHPSKFAYFHLLCILVSEQGARLTSFLFF